MLIFFMDPCPDCLRLSDVMGDHTMSCWMDGSWISTAGHYIIVLLIARNPLTNFLRGKNIFFLKVEEVLCLKGPRVPNPRYFVSVG